MTEAKTMDREYREFWVVRGGLPFRAKAFRDSEDQPWRYCYRWSAHMTPGSNAFETLPEAKAKALELVEKEIERLAGLKEEIMGVQENAR